MSDPELMEWLVGYRDHPHLFNTCVLGRSPYWKLQRDAAMAVVKYRDTIAYTGNAVGKDYLAAGLICWWLWTRPNSLVIVSGPSQALLGSVIWKELNRAIKGARFPVDAKISKGIKTSPHVVDLGNGWCALGYSTDTVERASGQHAAELLVVVTEASGLEAHAWEALDSLNHHRLFAAGNPIRPDGGFIDRIHQAALDERDGVPDHLRVYAIQIPSTMSPDAQCERSPRGLADQTWIEASERQHGEDSLWCGCHIHARIPTVGQDSLLSAPWLDFATQVPRPRLQPSDPRAGVSRMAIDLAEGVGRSKTVILIRDELGILEVAESNTMSLPDAAEAARRLALKWHVPHDRISYDKLGVGKDFGNHLARVGILTAKPYAASGGPRNRHEFVNLRTEAAWRLRNRLDPNWVPDPRNPNSKPLPFQIPPGPWWAALREELLVLTYDLVGHQTRLIDKKVVEDRLGRSPDLSDALIQSFAW